MGKHTSAYVNKYQRQHEERKKYGRKIRRMRRDLGLTQQQVAESVKISAGHLSACERGSSTPSELKRRALERFYREESRRRLDQWK